MKDATNLIIKKIKDNDSGFFENFEDLIKSGSQYNIKEAIEIGTKKIMETSNLILEDRANASKKV